MARKRYQDDPDNHDRWLVSYADFITLLFAFFVVMYALSSINEGKYRVLSTSLISAFSKSSPAIIPAEPPALPLRPRTLGLQKQNADALRREREQLTGIERDILKALAPLVNEGRVRVARTSRGLNIEISASVLFAPGEARLSGDSMPSLRAVAAVLKNDDHAIEVEGHTDSMPIRNALFPSNWELSAVRASSVVRLFVDSGVRDSRLTAVGYGSTRPLASNEKPEGRMRNRRVSILIVSHVPETASGAGEAGMSGGG